MSATSISAAETTPALLNAKAVARMCGCSVRQVYRMSDCGVMPRPIRLNRLVRWSRADLDRWIADGCRPIRIVKGGA
ncbi:MAG: AlpA family phage regulatory protein [Pirellulaceae bacterium]|nr:AlpA family phage regulatory protein [Pirellulaceae bacterium]